jgi:hypothetical protein
LLATIADGLLNRDKIDALKYVKIWAAVNVFRFLANLVILGIIALPITQAMTKHAGINLAPALIGHIILMVLLLCFAIIFLVFYNFDVIHIVAGAGKLEDAKHFGVPATYTALYLFTSLTSGSLIIMSCLKLMKNKLSKDGIFPYGGLLALSIILLALWDIVVVIGYNTVTRTYTKKDSAAFVTLGVWFQAIVFTLVALLSGSKSLADTAERERMGGVHEEKVEHNGLPESNGTNGTNGAHV